MDRIDQTTNAQNPHYPFHVLGGYVERHFSRDIFHAAPNLVTNGVSGRDDCVAIAHAKTLTGIVR
jgi:hypothetical protein